MSRTKPDGLSIALAALDKAAGPGQVAIGVSHLITSLIERRWERHMEKALEELERRLAALQDDTPSEEVDALAGRSPDRDRTLALLIAAFFLDLRRRAAVVLSATDLEVVHDAAERLLLSGGAGIAGGFDAGTPFGAEVLLAAQRDLPLMLEARVAAREAELRASIEAALSSREVRLTLGTVGPFREALRAALGLTGQAWIAPTVDAWAFRWRNAGAVAAAAAGRLVELRVFNNPPVGPDGRSTPFCRWLHGRTISVGQARLQVDRYVRSVLAGDWEGARQAWPLLDRAQLEQGGPGDANFLLLSLSIGLPPYHFFCRDVIVPA